MTVQYQVEAGGNEFTMTPQEIMFQANAALQGSPMTITAMTPDGLTAVINEAGQEVEVPVATLLADAGMNLKNAAPLAGNQDFEMVNAGWRYAIQNLEDDSQREAYLKQKLQGLGQSNPQVWGGGRDWHWYDPSIGKHRSLTNSPDFDWGDVTEGLSEATRIAGGVIGGSLGAAGGAAAGGIGAVPGAAAGAAAGNLAGEGLTRGIAAAFDPAYRDAFDLQKALVSAGTTTAVSGALPVAGKALQVGTRALPKVLQYGAPRPISSAMQTTGRVMQPAGAIMEGARIGTGPTGKFVGSMVTPGLSDVSMLGAAAQIPKYAVTLPAQGAKWIGKKIGPQAEEAVNRWVGPAQSVQDVFGGIAAQGTKLGRRADAWMRGAQAPTAMSDDLAAFKARAWGEAMGKPFDKLSRAGEGVMKGTEEAFGKTAGLISGTGALTRRSGELLKAGGQRFGGVEPFIYQQALAQQASTPNLPPNPLLGRQVPDLGTFTPPTTPTPTPAPGGIPPYNPPSPTPTPTLPPGIIPVQMTEEELRRKAGYLPINNPNYFEI